MWGRVGGGGNRCQATCLLDDELVAITEGLKAKGWTNKDDFRFKKCVMENYLDQIKDSTDTVRPGDVQMG